jgi:hypothetical protein
MVFVTKMNGYEKMCDTNKNVTKIGVIIKGVYCNLFGSRISMNSNIFLTLLKTWHP